MKNKSFTLIELLVVIVIIGILAGVIVVSTSSAIQKANFAKAQAFSSTVRNELFSDLVSEWTFDEGTDQTINRLATNNDVKDTGSSNNGMVYGNPQIKGGEDCVYGKCISFDGDDYIDCGDAQAGKFPLGSSPRTIIAWFKKNTSSLNNNHTAIVGWGNTNASEASYLEHDYNKIFFYAHGASDVIGITIIEDNVWYLGAAVSDGVRVSVYLNGSFENSEVASLNTTTSVVYIGKGKAFSFSGLIDDVRVYNAALSSAQIKKEYIAGLNSLLANNNITKEEYLEKIGTLASN